MTMKKVMLINNNNVWNPQRRYKVNEGVVYNGNIYQNITGANGNPEDLIDWLLISSMGGGGGSQGLQETIDIGPTATKDSSRSSVTLLGGTADNRNITFQISDGNNLTSLAETKNAIGIGSYKISEGKTAVIKSDNAKIDISESVRDSTDPENIISSSLAIRLTTPSSGVGNVLTAPDKNGIVATLDDIAEAYQTLQQVLDAGSPFGSITTPIEGGNKFVYINLDQDISLSVAEEYDNPEDQYKNRACFFRIENGIPIVQNQGSTLVGDVFGLTSTTLEVRQSTAGGSRTFITPVDKPELPEGQSYILASIDDVTLQKMYEKDATTVVSLDGESVFKIFQSDDNTVMANVSGGDTGESSLFQTSPTNIVLQNSFNFEGVSKLCNITGLQGLLSLTQTNEVGFTKITYLEPIATTEIKVPAKPEQIIEGTSVPYTFALIEDLSDNIRSSASAMDIMSNARVAYRTYTGAVVAVWTMPTLANNEKLRLVLYNTGTGIVTVNTNSGDNDIYDSGTTKNTLALSPGTRIELFNNGEFYIMS